VEILTRECPGAREETGVDCASAKGVTRQKKERENTARARERSDLMIKILLLAT